MNSVKKLHAGNWKPPASPLTGYVLTNADRQRPRLGRLRRQISRALIAANGKPLRIGALLSWCYPRVPTYLPWHRANIHRAIVRVAQPVGTTRKRAHLTLGALLAVRPLVNAAAIPALCLQFTSSTR
jgi:hypothetical protein